VEECIKKADMQEEGARFFENWREIAYAGRKAAQTLSPTF
jgi:hypothetical protein